MAVVFITGGTGRLGRELLPRLVEARHDVRALVRRDGVVMPDGVHAVRGDLSHPDLFPSRALDGVEQLVHLASGAADRAIDGVDLEGTALLLERAREAGRPHVLYLSIVGIERSEYPLYRAKVEVERMLAEAGLPWTSLRTTQFHELIRDWLMAAPGRHFPAGMRYQPVACADVARFVAGLLARPPANGVVEMGGPEIFESTELARIFAEVTGRPAPTLPPRAEDGPAPDALLAPSHREGRVTWRQFLEQQRAG